MIRVKCNAKLLDPKALRDCALFLRENVVTGFSQNKIRVRSNEVSDFLMMLANIVEKIQQQGPTGIS